MKSYQEMYDKFYGKSVSFQITENQYSAGIVEAIDINESNIIYIIDEFGQEHAINYSFRDVVVHG